jgi:hypothetical protein
MPFFTFNYLVLGNPFSITETTPLTDKQVTLYTANDYISLDENPEKDKQTKLLDQLGFTWNLNIRANWLEILGYSLFLKLNNTFGIFIFSPFLIIALAFIIEKSKRKLKFNGLDIFFGIYLIILLGSYCLLKVVYNIDALLFIMLHTPAALDYRYLLILYVVLLYFVLRMDSTRKLIEDHIKKIVLMSGIILIIILIFNLILFARSYPVHLMDIFYYVSIATSMLLLIFTLLNIMKADKKSSHPMHENLLIFLIAAAIAEAAILLLFYYWVVSMTYISPSQNHTIVPVLENILKWMSQVIMDKYI